MTWRIMLADCLEAMAAMPEASIDAIVCDPPYGLEFMGKEWDNLTGANGFRRAANPADVGRDDPFGRVSARGPEYIAGRRAQEWHGTWAREALRVLKPGGHLLAFGGTRTFHRLTCALEDAGFEIRDCLSWLYGSGFPKSLDVSKAIDAWQGWGTALKPAWEPIVLARKPLAGTVAANVLAHGTGALNVDGCRIEGSVPKPGNTGPTRASGSNGIYGRDERLTRQAEWEPASGGRWPPNVTLDPEAAIMLDEQTGELVSGANPTRRGSDKFRTTYGDFEGQRECVPARGGDSGGASRFFYVAKPDAEERNVGLHGDRNVHPTVKPVELMRWLIRLVTPPEGIVLDPFAGSGTTGIAAMREQRSFIGIEREAEYVEIARARIIGDAPLLNSIAEAA